MPLETMTDTKTQKEWWAFLRSSEWKN
jgi:hypothetical protein